MDLSRLSEADLRAVAAGDMSSVSEAGLRMLTGGTPKSGFLPAAKAGWAGLKGDIAALAGRTGLVSPEEAERARANLAAEAAATFKPTEKGWLEAPVQKTLETAGGSLPYMAAPVVAGGAAALGGAPAAVGMGLAGLTSAAQFTGSNLSRQIQEGARLADTNLGAAAAAAVPQAALDMVGFKFIPGIRQIFRAAGRELPAAAAAQIAKQSIGQVARDYAVATGKAMGVEGLTEAGQQVLERMQAGLSISDPQARQEYLDSFVGGAVLGGVVAPVGRFHERGKLQAQQAQQEAALRSQAAQEAQAQAAQEAQARAAQYQDPAYAQQVAADYQAAEARFRELRDAAKVPKDAPMADKLAAQQTREALKQFVEDELRPKAAEYNRVKPLLAKTAQDTAAAQERARVAGMSPEEYAAEQMQGAGAPAPAVPGGAVSPYEMPVATPEQQYAQQQIEALQYHMPAASQKDLVDYLLADPKMAAQLAQSRVQLPGLTPKQSEATHDALVVNLKAMQKQAQKNLQEKAKTPGAGAAQIAAVEGEEQEAALQQQAAYAAEMQRLADENQAAIREARAQRKLEESKAKAAPDVYDIFNRAPPAGSAALGQMQQELTGQERTFTAAPQPGEPIGAPRRAGPAPFNLYPRREGTAAPVARQELQQRVDALLRTSEIITPETAAYLQRLDRALASPALESQPGALDLIDKQLAKIERGEEGVARAGVGRMAEFQKMAPVDSEASVAAPTVASGPDIAAFQAGQRRELKRGVKQPEAEARARQVTVAPVKVRQQDMGPETLRGPSAQTVPLSHAAELEPVLREHERAGVDEGRQAELFSETGITPRGAVKATPEEFDKFAFSPYVRKLRKEAKAPVAAPAEAKKPTPKEGSMAVQQRRAASKERSEHQQKMLELAERLSELPTTKVRALTPEERVERGLTKDDELELSSYERRLRQMDKGWLQKELGKAEKQLRDTTAAVKAAKERTGKYVGGPENVVTFRGLGQAIRRQAVLGEHRRMLSDALDAVDAREHRIEAGPRKTEPVSVSQKQQEALDAQLENVQLLGAQKDRVAALEKAVGAAKGKDKATLQGKLDVERTRLHELQKQVSPEGRVSMAERKVGGAPAKLRTGTEESKRATGSVGQRVQEERRAVQRNKAITTAEQQEANVIAEQYASLKPKLTKAAIRAADDAQREQLNTAVQDQIQHRHRMLDDLRMRIAAMQRAAKPDAVKLKELIDQQRRMEGELASLRNNAATLAKAAGAEEDVSAPSVARVTRTSTPLDLATRIVAERGDVRSMLQYLAVDASTPGAQALANKLLPLTANVRFGVDRDVKHNGVPVAGVYDPKTNKVTMHPRGLTEEDVLHELVHAATDSVLLADVHSLTPEQQQARADLERMQRQLVSHPNFKSEHIGDVREFAAEVMTNPQVQAKLRALGKPVTLWTRFVNAVLRLLGFKVDSAPDVRAQELVEQLMTRSQEITGPATAAPSVQRSAADLAGEIIAQPQSFKDRFSKNFELAAEMWGVDMRAPLMKALGAAGERAARQASYLVRKADARMSHTYATLSAGPLQVKKDAKGFLTIEAGNGPSAKKIFDAVSRIPGDDAKAKMDMAQVYLTAKRAARVGWEKLDFDPARVGALQAKAEAMMREVDADPVAKAALEEVSSLYNDYNKGLIGFLSQTGAIPKAKAAELLKHGDYVPFYRVRPDGTAELVMGEGNVYNVGNIRTQPYLRELKGGDQRLLPLNESLIRNTMLLTDMGMRNMATKDVAYALQAIGAPVGAMKIRRGDGGASPNVIRFKQEPDPNVPRDDGERHLVIDTAGTAVEGIPADMLAQSMEGSFSALPSFLKVAGWFGDVLRSGVTRNPMYVARQLIRDPMAATFTAGLDSGPLTATAKTIKEFTAQMQGRSETAETLLRKGVVHSNIFTGDVDDMSKFSLQLAKGDQNAYQKLISFWDAAAMRADAATRAQMYDSALKQGMSEMEAELAAMEMMNFNKRGISPTVQFASRMIPFFNAQIQGLNVLYKAATGQMPMEERLNIKEKFFKRAMLLAGFTLMYAAAMDDDETYKNARPRDRYNNFFLPNPLGGEHLKLPIPFEVGVLFKALPEAMLDMVKGKFGDEEWKALKQVFTQQIPGSGSYGIPQMARPILEVASNSNWYTGREIETAADKRLLPQERAGRNTSEFAKRMSETLASLPVEALQLSPKQIEHLTTGYLGTLPIAVARLTNSVFASEETNPVTPEMRGSDLPVFGALFQKEYGGGPIDAAYAQAQALEQASATFQKMLNEGRVAQAMAFRENAVNVVASPQLAKTYTTRMRAFTKAEAAIRRSESDPAKMRERLDELDKQRNEFSKLYLQAVSHLAK